MPVLPECDGCHHEGWDAEDEIHGVVSVKFVEDGGLGGGVGVVVGNMTWFLISVCKSWEFSSTWMVRRARPDSDILVSRMMWPWISNTFLRFLLVQRIELPYPSALSFLPMSQLSPQILCQLFTVHNTCDGRSQVDDCFYCFYARKLVVRGWCIPSLPLMLQPLRRELIWAYNLLQH
jgi:hypothetical protein